jgi:indolepyruvate ferredoxin oxidoreductase beta subunit
VNTRPFKISGTEYPDVKEILNGVCSFTENIVSIDAVALAEKAGSAVTLNIVMVGALAAAGKLPIKAETLREALRELVPAKYLDINMTAFELGYEAVKASTKRSK